VPGAYAEQRAIVDYNLRNAEQHAIVVDDGDAEHQCLSVLLPGMSEFNSTPLFILLSLNIPTALSVRLILVPVSFRLRGLADNVNHAAVVQAEPYALADAFPCRDAHGPRLRP